MKDASKPIIVSASRSTDIPAFYCEWFFNRLKEGHSVWMNPFNNQRMVISYENVRFIVFWSKNPSELLKTKYKAYLDERNIGSYIQFTLNDYVKEDLEPNVLSVDVRIETFKRLVDLYGPEHVVWRYDPLILTDCIREEDLIRKIEYIGDKLNGYTSKLVFSFCDIVHYPKVKRNLENYGVKYTEWSESRMKSFAYELSKLNNKWNYKLATCAEAVDLSEYGILKNKCVDDELIAKISYNDSVLMDYLGIKVKNIQTNLLGEIEIPDNAIILNDKQYAIRTKTMRDKGQRLLCGCVASKDIGEYNTCIHKCKYCYANVNNDVAMCNFKRHLANKNSETITGL